MAFFYSIIGFLIAIGVLVAVHEFGHFWVARKLGVKVLKFSIGFGKPLWTKKFGEDQTTFVLAAIPLGGYVQMLGENDPNAPVRESERHRAFDNLPIWKRSLIVLAGPAINFLFAALLFMGLGLSSTQQLAPVFGDVPASSAVAKAGIGAGDQLVAVDGKPVSYFGQHDLYMFNKVLKNQNFELSYRSPDASLGAIEIASIDVSGIPIYNINPGLVTRTLGITPVYRQPTTIIQVLVEGEAAAMAGLEVGDEVVAVDGVEVSGWRHLVEIISVSAQKSLNLTVLRDDLTLRLPVTPKSVDDGQGGSIGRIGISPKISPYQADQVVQIENSVLGAMFAGIERTWLMSSVTLRMLWKMVTGQVSPKNISGPITIADYAGQAIQVSFSYYLSVLAIISISLGVMNLLPIPMLDGGHILVYMIEAVGGKNLAEKFFEIGQKVGVFMLLCLMSLAFYNDIFRLLN